MGEMTGGGMELDEGVGLGTDRGAGDGVAEGEKSCICAACGETEGGFATGGVGEGDAVGVLAGLRAEAADHSDFRFFVLFGPAKDELLLRGKLMAGKNARAVKAEENGGGVLGKDAAVQIAADEEDGNLLRDASAAAHNLWWQARGQRGGRGGTI